MIPVKEAAQSALAFARDLLGDNRVNSLLLEEIELSDDQTEWLVTVSVPTARLPATGLGMLATGSGAITEPREYKVIRVDAGNGLPKSLKIRKL
jgi:hypothetical protein